MQFLYRKALNFSCSGILPQAEPAMVEVDLETAESAEHSSANITDVKEERTTIGKLWVTYSIAWKINT